MLVIVFAASFFQAANAEFLEYSEKQPATLGSRMSQLHASKNNVYVLWQESTHGKYYFDLLFRKSSDYGKTFDPTINLTEGNGFYPESQIQTDGNNVYVVWSDGDPSKRQNMFFKKSPDNGNTFDDIYTIDPTDSSYYRLVGFEISDHVIFVFMAKYDPQTQKSSIIFKKSQDYGKTFDDPQVLFEFEKRFDYLDLESQNGTIHAVVNGDGEYEEPGKILYRKIIGNNEPSQIIQLNRKDSSVFAPQLSVSGNNVYVIWREIIDKKHSISFAKSSDNGETFSEATKLNKDPSSVDVVWDASSQIESNGESVYIRWFEEYYDGIKQTFHGWYATSSDAGKTFQVKLHPLDKKIGHTKITTVQQGDTTYLVSSVSNYTSINEPETFFAKSTGGSAFETINLTENTREQIWDPYIAVSENNIYVAGSARDGKHCLYVISSSDSGDFFGDMVDINNYTPHKRCANQLQLAAFSPLKQKNAGIDLDKITCPGNMVLIFKKSDGEPACVKPKTGEKLLLRPEWMQRVDQVRLMPEPHTRIEVSTGKTIGRSLLPIIVSEITENAESLDTITVWKFIPFEYNADNIRNEWDILEQPNAVWYQITGKNGQAIIDQSRMPNNYAITDDMHMYTLYCNDQKIFAESAHPSGFPVNPTDTIIARNSDKGIYPDKDDRYTIRFASLFEQKIILPDDAEIVTQKHQSCLTEFQGKIRNGYYDEVVFRLD